MTLRRALPVWSVRPVRPAGALRATALRPVAPLAPWRNGAAVRFLCDKPKEEAKAEGEAEAEAEAEAGAVQEEAAGAGAASAELEGKVTDLEAEVKKLNEAVRVALAEAENARSIAKRDVASARDFAISKFAKGLLDVADNFDRAIDAAKTAPEDADPAKQLEDLLEGVTMIEAQLQKAFAEHQVSRRAKPRASGA